MIEKVTRYSFIDTFMKIRPDNFSRSGLNALFDYIEELEEGMGEQIEFDVIALCCDFMDFKNEEEIREAYDIPADEEISDYTTVIEHDEGVIIQQF